jgi:hypothetical protein
MTDRITPGSRFCCVLFGLSFLLTGCDVSEAPMSDPKDAKINEKLFGTWEEEAELPRSFLAFSKVSADGYPPGVMLMKHTSIYLGGFSWLFFCSEIKGKTYANVCCIQISDAKKLPPWEKARTGPFKIYKFAIEDDTLVTWEVDLEVLKNAVKTKRMKGTIREAKPGDLAPTITLQETTPRVAEFILAEDANLFPAQAAFPTKVVWKRAK